MSRFLTVSAASNSAPKSPKPPPPSKPPPTLPPPFKRAGEFLAMRANDDVDHSPLDFRSRLRPTSPKPGSDLDIILKSSPTSSSPPQERESTSPPVVALARSESAFDLPIEPTAANISSPTPNTPSLDGFSAQFLSLDGDLQLSITLQTDKTVATSGTVPPQTPDSNPPFPFTVFAKNTQTGCSYRLEKRDSLWSEYLVFYCGVRGEPIPGSGARPFIQHELLTTSHEQCAGADSDDLDSLLRFGESLDEKSEREAVLRLTMIVKERFSQTKFDFDLREESCGLMNSSGSQSAAVWKFGKMASAIRTLAGELKGAITTLNELRIQKEIQNEEEGRRKLEDLNERLQSAESEVENLREFVESGMKEIADIHESLAQRFEDQESALENLKKETREIREIIGQQNHSEIQENLEQQQKREDGGFLIDDEFRKGMDLFCETQQKKLESVREEVCGLKWECAEIMRKNEALEMTVKTLRAQGLGSFMWELSHGTLNLQPRQEEDTNSLFVESTGSLGSVVGQRSLTPIRSSFAIRVVETKSKVWNCSIGISTLPYINTWVGNTVQSWAFIRSGEVYHSGQRAKQDTTTTTALLGSSPATSLGSPRSPSQRDARPYASSWAVGDTIVLHVDFTNGDVEFQRNGLSLGTAFRLALVAPFYPVVSLSNLAAVEILN